MHTYVKSADGKGWQAGYATTGPTAEHTVKPMGPVFEKEEEAASFASYMNGGRWSPGELAGVLPPQVDPEVEAEKAREERREADKANRPAGMDYPPEDTKPKAKAHAAKRKGEVKHSAVAHTIAKRRRKALHELAKRR